MRAVTAWRHAHYEAGPDIFPIGGPQRRRGCVSGQLPTMPTERSGVSLQDDSFGVEFVSLY